MTTALKFAKLPDQIFVLEYDVTYKGQTWKDFHACLTPKTFRLRADELKKQTSISNIRGYCYVPQAISV